MKVERNKDFIRFKVNPSKLSSFLPVSYFLSSSKLKIGGSNIYVNGEFTRLARYD